MDAGTVTGSIDLAQIVLYAFFAFFAGLVWYLHGEDKREGYPLVPERAGGRLFEGLPPVPAPKTFHLASGAKVSRPGPNADTRAIAAMPVSNAPGSPLQPTGDPMRDGVGPAAWAERADVPDVTPHGQPKIVPMRGATGYWLETRDSDPRGMAVVGADRQIGGKIVDAWVDRSEMIIRYLELELAGAPGRNVLLPINFARIDGKRRQVNVKALYGKHFANVPGLRTPGQITLLEEDKICGYYGGGTLYAHPGRTESML